MNQRTRDWRRAKARAHGRTHKKDLFSKLNVPEKKWELLYTRSVKLARARQLGKIWPSQEWKNLLNDSVMTNVLFICSMNQWRSPTAEKVFQKEPGIAVRSAGTVRGARRTVSVQDIRWSDIILVMEEKHKSRLIAQFRDEVRYKTLHVLDIPDEYKYMDPELVEIVREAATPFIRIEKP